MVDYQSRPTMVRYLILFTTFLVALVMYLHRYSIVYVQRYLREDLGMDYEQLSYCMSAFSVAYALAQVPSGWFSDRFGARSTLAFYVIAWSCFTALVGLTLGFVMLFLLRAAVGVSQAGGYPTAASLIKRWTPFASRGKASSFVAFGGRMGAAITPILTAYLVIAFVPLGTPATLAERDFLDVDYFAYQIDKARSAPTPGGKQAVAARLYEQFSPHGQETIRVLGARYREKILQQRQESGAEPKYDPRLSRNFNPMPDRVEPLRTELNALLGAGQVYTADDFVELSLDREAISLAALAERTTPQQERLHRLALETVFPESVRKIYGQGWRPVMFLYGGLGIAVAVLFWLVFRERPAEHPWCNRDEQALIEKGQPLPTPTTQARAFPWKKILESRNLWLMATNHFFGNLGWVFLVSWLPRYLDEVHQTPYLERNWLASMPLVFGWVGILVGGWLTDHLTQRFGLRYRTASIVLGRFMAAAAFLSCMYAPNVWFATAAFALIAFSNDLCNPASWAFKQDVGGRYVGAILGWTNMFGNFGAALSPVLLNEIITRFGWSPTFMTGAAAFAIAGFAAVGIDASIPVDDGKDA
ncbi:MFS transporter [Lignipirellula cremea]|uniref:D-galactonate transporter n=1 Tax=Lignipirellula cremea TaxID=2528010 RepID=A0A518DN04_9BACT|nr:MFS transporter [Lignipirellula cremea]QDU93220.1 D-galactonate transporter [Lignipirellula cremea]